VSVSNRLVIAHRTASQDGTDTERVQLAASPITVGSLEGNAPLENYYNGYTTFIMGGNDRSTHFFGNIYDYQYGKGLALVKMGAGTFTFWGEGLYRGTNRVESGTFLVNGYMLGQFVVTNAGVLGGVGLIDSNVTVQSGGVLNPGASVGRLVTRDVTFDAGGTFTAEINGPTPETDYDQLQVNGTVGLGSSTLNLVLGYTPAIGTSFTIIDNDGTSDAVVGTFNCAGKTQVLAPMPMLFRVDYAGGDGNDVVVTRLPLQPGSLFIVR
jgi:hypothetical protein